MPLKPIGESLRTTAPQRVRCWPFEVAMPPRSRMLKQPCHFKRRPRFNHRDYDPPACDLVGFASRYKLRSWRIAP
jgi:hypothetical protein